MMSVKVLGFLFVVEELVFVSAKVLKKAKKVALESRYFCLKINVCPIHILLSHHHPALPMDT